MLNLFVYQKTHHGSICCFFWLLFSLFTLLAWLGVCSLDVGKVELWMTCNTSSLTMWSLRGSGFPGGLGSMMCFFRKLLSSSKSYWNKYKFFQPHIMEVPKSCVYFFLLDMIQNLLGSEPGFCLDVIFVAPCNPIFVGLKSGYMKPTGDSGVWEIDTLRQFELQGLWNPQNSWL